MSAKAVGTDWMSSSKVTWRHAAGNPATCSYVKPKGAEKAAPAKTLAGLKKLIAKGGKQS